MHPGTGKEPCAAVTHLRVGCVVGKWMWDWGSDVGYGIMAVGLGWGLWCGIGRWGIGLGVWGWDKVWDVGCGIGMWDVGLGCGV